MLAHHLKRLDTSVRYALDPAHEQAIRNYLAIASRAQNVSAMHAAPNTQRILGDAAPLGNELHQTMMQQHDPASLAGLIDLLSDQGAVPWTGTGTTPNHSLLLRTLLHMNRMISGYGGRDENNKLLGAGAHPAVLRGYGDEGLGNLQLADRTGREVQHLVPAMYSLLNNRYAQRHLSPQLEATRPHIMDLAYGGTRHPLSVVGLHDTLGGLHEAASANMDDELFESRQLPQNARVLQGSMRNLLGTLHPALWHFGEHGTLPQ